MVLVLVLESEVLVLVLGTQVLVLVLVNITVTRSSSLLDSNYFMRMLFKNTGCALVSTASILYFITALDS